ncbi:Methyltransferase [Candidatus Magnetomorum sp. HK-1]|nr:Methyltransferase [Candidatus Magnetomorum sp. HK-1]
MFSIESFNQTYETEIIPLTIRDKQFSFLMPKKLDDFIDKSDSLNNFPMWAKIWEASLVLADHIAGQYKSPKTILELGSGLGVTGIIAAAFGHKVTLTEYDPHAIQFLHANAHINNCIKNIDIKFLDWKNPKIDSTFDMIVGSELIYKERAFPSLVSLFHKYVSKKGEILLTTEPRKASKPFLDMMMPWYKIQIWRKRMRAADATRTVLLIRLTARDEKDRP